MISWQSIVVLNRIKLDCVFSKQIVGLNEICSLLTTRLPFTLPSLVHKQIDISKSSESFDLFNSTSIFTACYKKFRAGSCFGVLDKSETFLAENSEFSFLNLVCRSIEVFLMSLIVIVLESIKDGSIGEIIVLRASKCGVKLPRSYLCTLTVEVVVKSVCLSKRGIVGS